MKKRTKKLLSVLAVLACLLLADRLFPPNLARYRAVSTEVLASDGSELAALPAPGGIWRLRTSPADIDPNYLMLLVASEDRHFAEHRGMDASALLRAAWQWLRAGHIVSGGSTLTMQTARLLEPHTRSVAGKLHDLIRALQLERRYTKDQILGIYLTLAPFGANVEGVRAASEIWFGHEPDHLTPAEAALLVALPQSPSRRRPDRHPAAAQLAMARLSQRLIEAGRNPSWLPVAPALPATARHAMPRLAGLFATAQSRHAPQGAIVRTTIDAVLQRRLQALLTREMAPIDPQVGVAAMVVDNKSRAILASVGGRGASFPGGAIDLTATRRSPGSALKPFIYGLAFDELLLHPLTVIPDAPGMVPGYAPHNFDYEFHGAVTAQTALRQSFNVPAVEVLSRVGPDRFVASLRQAGAAIVVPGNRPSLAVALGGLGINLRDMVMLYAALADDGRAAPLATTPAVVTPSRPFLGPLAVWYVRQILLGSPPPPGMAYAALTGGREVAYKTGTSYGFRDAWAVGYSATTTIGIWTGRVDGTPRPGAFGRATAAPLMLDAFTLLPPEDPATPAPPANAILAPTTGDLPPGLRRLGGFPAGRAPGPVLNFPPPGSTIDLITATNGAFAPVELRVAGGAPPYRWLLNGAPTPGADRTLHWRPDGPGTVRVTVLDALDHAVHGTFQLAAGVE